MKYKITLSKERIKNIINNLNEFDKKHLLKHFEEYLENKENFNIFDVGSGSNDDCTYDEGSTEYDGIKKEIEYEDCYNKLINSDKTFFGRCINNGFIKLKNNKGECSLGETFSYLKNTPKHIINIIYEIKRFLYLNIYGCFEESGYCFEVDDTELFDEPVISFKLYKEYKQQKTKEYEIVLLNKKEMGYNE